MNDTTKKVVLIVVVVLAVVFAIFEGKSFVMGPSETKKEIGHAAPGQGMKAQERAEEEAAAKGGPPPAQNGTDPLAGPAPK